MNISESQRKIILINVCLGIFMSTLDSGIVNIALPVISSSLKADISTVQWVVSSYILTISALLLTFGRISDIYGRNRIYALGYAVFTIGSMFCGLSNSITLLIISRVIQAVGAAILMANSQAIITETFPREERGKALGLSGSAVAIGSLSGPGIGGFLIHLLGWKSIFLVNIPIGIAGFIITRNVIPKSKIVLNEKFDYKGSIMFGAGIVLLFIGLIGIQDKIASMTTIEIVITIALALIAAFLFTQSKIEYPLMDLKLFKNPVFSLGLGAAFISFLATFSVSILMPFYLQSVLNYSIGGSGVIMMVYPAVMAIAAPISGRFSDKIGYRTLTIAGLTINVISLLLLSRLGLNAGFIQISAILALLGMGVSLFTSPNNSSIMGSVPVAQLSIAAGINSLVRNLGMISGVTFSMLLFHYYVGKFSTSSNLQSLVFVESMGSVFFIAAMICIISIVLAGVRSQK